MVTLGSSLCLLSSPSPADLTFYTSPGFILFSPSSCHPLSYHHFLPRSPQWPPNWSAFFLPFQNHAPESTLPTEARAIFNQTFRSHHIAGEGS